MQGYLILGPHTVGGPYLRGVDEGAVHQAGIVMVLDKVTLLAKCITDLGPETGSDLHCV